MQVWEEAPRLQASLVNLHLVSIISFCWLVCKHLARMPLAYAILSCLNPHDPRYSRYGFISRTEWK